MIVCCDCLKWLRAQPDNSIDLIFGSPPYEDARAYGSLGFSLKGQEWVDWMVERWVEMDRVCRGLVAMVVEGKTRNYRWSATPALLMADLHRRGINLRKPPAFSRVGIPGSGGPDWLRNNYEFIICSSNGRLPWSDNTAMGRPCVYGPGGAMSHRTKDGTRAGKMRKMIETNGAEPKVALALESGLPPGGKLHTKNNGTSMRVQCYTPPEKANPGNIIECSVGGGRMGSWLAHENEAPFPEKLAEFFVASFCPPGGTVLDPFCGSGTTLSVAQRLGRAGIGLDVRQDQCDLSNRRLAESMTP